MNRNICTLNAVQTMGAKTPASTVKRPSKCEICKNSFQTLAALKSHTRANHPSAVQNDEENESKDEKKTAFVPPTSRVSKRLQLRKKSSDTESLEKNPKPVPAGIKPQFECPKCLKIFPVYFSALKHIQKRHIDVQNSSNTNIKPIPIEICKTCDKRIDVNHECGEHVDAKADGGAYCCLGCEMRFKSVNAFDQHVAVAHNENADIMAFKEYSDFLLWKSSMERQVCVKYLTLSNTSNKQYYQCNFVSPKNSSDVTHLCPSVVISRQIGKGVRIHYYKNHHGHSCPAYKAPNQYIGNIVVDPPTNDDFDRLLTDKKSTEENDLYEKFTGLLKKVLVRSGKVNSTNLKKMYSLASEMENIINSQYNTADDNDSINNDDYYDREIENTKTDISINKSMTDDQISKVLETPRASARIKRRSESLTPNIVKKKKINDTNLKENTPIARKPNSPMVVKPAPIISSPSFNDSYKEFIGSTAKTPKAENINNSPKNSTNKKSRKVVVKTKIGQFIPSPEKQKNLEISKKKSKTSKSPERSLDNLKLDIIDYEVVEQENDCNILVLKI